MASKTAVRDGPLPRLSIALVTETFPPEVNGVAHTLSRLAKGLGDRGHRLQIIRPRQPGECQQRGEELLVPGLPLPGYPGLRFGLPAGRRLRRFWHSQRPHVIYAATEGPLGWSAVGTAKHLGIPCISGFHTRFEAYSSHYGAGLLRLPIERYLRTLHRRTLCTLVPTEQLRRHLADRGFGPLEVVGRGVDTERFCRSRRREALRRNWGAEPEDPVVLYVGRLAPEKNLPLALKAAAAMQAANPRVRFVVIGDGPLYPRLQRHGREVIFCGTRTGVELAEHYASADILLFPSETETFGNVVLEGMASGLSVVAYDYAAAHALIAPGVDGLLAPFGDEASFVAAACQLACDRTLVKRLGDSAARKAKDHDWSQVIDRFESLLVRATEGERDDER